MDNLSNKNQRFIFNSIYIVFVFSIVFLFGIAIDLKIGVLVQLLSVAFISLLIKFFIFNPLIFYSLLTIAFIITLLISHYFSSFLQLFVDRTYFLFSNIVYNLLGKERILEENIFVFWIILIGIISLFTAFVIFKSKKIYLLLPVYFSIYLYYWYNFYDQAFWMISIFLMAYFILTGIIKYSSEIKSLDTSLKQNFEKLYAPWIRTSYTYAILIVLISLLLPKGYNYIRWPWLQNKVYNAFPIVEELRSYNNYSRGAGGAGLFDFSVTGFQQSPKKLGGPVQLSDKKIMTVLAKNKNYLRGNVKHIYTGSYWESIDLPWDNYTLRQDFSGLTQEEMDLFFEVEDITISNHNFASTTLFSPYLPKFVNLLENSWISVGKDYTLNLSKGIYDNESYFVRTLKPLPYGKLVSLGIDNRKENLKDLDVYLQIPDEKITSRTKALVSGIVQYSNSDFDKAKDIEDYLRKNYKYNINVNLVPENHEFIDYFLFEEKEGYCTYFATSMAIMLRLEGIPSRYIEGYIAHDLNENGNYEVRQENAHAWVEAFIEPVGWMTFEATPEYPIEDRLEDYAPNDRINEDIESVNKNTDSKPNNGFNEDPDMDFELDVGVGGWNLDRENPYDDVTTDFSKNSLFIMLGILLSLIPIRYIIGVIRYHLEENKAKKLPNNNRIIFLYDKTLKLVSQLGFPQQYGETHFEYAQRIAYKFYEHEKIGIKEITDLFVKVKYSNSLASDDQVLVLEEYRYNLEKRLKNYVGRRVYYFNKYLRFKS